MSELITTEAFTKKGLELPKGLDFDEWVKIGDRLKRIEGGLMWWWGDWLNYGESEYGEKFSQALESSDYSYSTLQQAAWVASKIELSRRRDTLPFAHHQEVASLESEEQDLWLDVAEKEELSQKELRKHIKQSKKVEIPPPQGKYRIIYADPPWEYSDTRSGLKNYSGAEDHYPTMTLTQLCELPINDLAEENAVLFIWTTSPLLEDAFKVIAAWQFNYKASFIWDKIKHNYGHYNSVRHEFLLVCTRGSCLPDESKLFDSVVVEERGKHSAKPASFRKMIDELYTTGGRIELFARGEVPDDWEAWGKESG